jgi:hypothetical protein
LNQSALFFYYFSGIDGKDEEKEMRKRFNYVPECELGDFYHSQQKNGWQTEIECDEIENVI